MIYRRSGLDDSAAAPGLRQKCQQPCDQDEPDAKDGKHIQYADFEILTGENEIVIVDEFKQGQTHDEKNDQYERDEGCFSRPQWGSSNESADYQLLQNGYETPATEPRRHFGPGS
jgi:hypothetical protein